MLLTARGFETNCAKRNKVLRDEMTDTDGQKKNVLGTSLVEILTFKIFKTLGNVILPVLHLIGTGCNECNPDAP